MQSYLDSPQYQALLAQALRGGPASQYPGQALANAGSQIVNALALKNYEGKQQAREGDYSRAIANALAPQPVDSVAVTPQITGPGQVEQRDLAGAYSQPTEKDLLTKLLGSGNADVTKDFAPLAVQSQMQAQALANQPIRPIERAQLAGQRRTSEAQLANLLADNARQDRLADPKYKAEVARAEADATVADRIKVAQAGRPVYPGQSGPFGGTGIDAQVMNILIKGDPASPEFAAAYAKAAEPKMQYDPQTGQITPIVPDMTPYRKPIAAGGGQQAPAPVGAPSASGAPQAQAAPGTPTVGGPIQVGAPRLNEFQQKVGGLYTVAKGAAPIIDKYENAGIGSSGIYGKVGGALSGGYLGSDEYKQLQQAGDQLVQSYLYSVSGAQAPEPEVARWRSIALPQPTDPEAVKANKRKTRAAMMTAMERNAKLGKPGAAQIDPQTGELIGEGSGDGWKVERAQQ